MSTYFVTPIHPDEWEFTTSNLKFNPEQLADQITTRWQDAEVNLSEDTNMPWWSFSTNGDNGFLSGHLQKDRQTVSLSNGPEHSFTDFVLWLRQMVPEEFRLFLFNEGESQVLELDMSVSKENISEFMNWTR